VLDGITVVELGAWVAGPSAGAMLADWGAEVWKVEPPGGDPFRRIVASQGYSDDIPNAPFLLDNRGKRSVSLDLRNPDAAEALELMLAQADVLVTNMRVGPLTRLGLGPHDTLGRHPRLIYGLITGYGSAGPDRSRPGYDTGAFAARTGVLHQMRAGGAPPTALPLGFGDHVVGLATVAGVLGALLERGRTGKGQLIETSLLRTGMYALGWELAVQLLLGRVPGGASRENSKTPMVNCYRCADDSWFWLLGVEADRHFPAVTEALQRPDLLTDERFATARDRRRNHVEIIQELDHAFASRPLVEWAELFDIHGVWWAPVSTPADVVADPQARAAGGFVVVRDSDSETVATPVDFHAHPTRSVFPAPDLGADTVDVLRSVGCAEDLIERLSDTRPQEPRRNLDAPVA
jgi:crotonobetainyl-CoA:carnitine CoA-transferase CaiB-like acyl-CoA transferase